MKLTTGASVWWRGRVRTTAGWYWHVPHRTLDAAAAGLRLGWRSWFILTFTKSFQNACCCWTHAEKSWSLVFWLIWFILQQKKKRQSTHVVNLCRQSLSLLHAFNDANVFYLNKGFLHVGTESAFTSARPFHLKHQLCVAMWKLKTEF